MCPIVSPICVLQAIEEAVLKIKEAEMMQKKRAELMNQKKSTISSVTNFLTTVYIIGRDGDSYNTNVSHMTWLYRSHDTTGQ